MVFSAKILLSALILLSQLNTCLSQQDYLDSILNNYERKYRTELNKSDSLLIDVYVEIIKKDCDELKLYLDSIAFSGSFKAGIVRNLIDQETCTIQILENIGMEQYSSSSERPSDIVNFPIIHLLQDSLLMEKMIQQVSEDEALCKENADLENDWMERYYTRCFLRCYKEKRKGYLKECESEFIEEYIETASSTNY